jgi:hypothetical protein
VCVYVSWVVGWVGAVGKGRGWGCIDCWRPCWRQQRQRLKHEVGQSTHLDVQALGVHPPVDVQLDQVQSLVVGGLRYSSTVRHTGVSDTFLQ